MLLTDILPQGENPFYDLDYPEFAAAVVGYKGIPPVMESNGKRIFFPTFSVTITDYVQEEEIAYRRFPAFDRAKERVAIATAIAEDDLIFNLLDDALAKNGNIQKHEVTSGKIQREHTTQLVGQLMSHNLGSGAFVMHPMRYSDILSWGYNDVDQATLNIIIETGSIGVLYGTRMIVSNRVNPRMLYLTTTPDKLGRIPERKSMEVKVANLSWLNRYAVTSLEIAGFGIHNANGVTAMNYTDTSSALPMPAVYPIS